MSAVNSVKVAVAMSVSLHHQQCDSRSHSETPCISAL